MKLKSLFLTSGLTMFLFTSCYEDKGNYNYDTMAQVTLDVASGKSIQMGGTLRLEANVQTDVPDEDLRYEWQLYRSSGFTTIAEGKSVDYMFAGNYFPTPGNYELRLKALQQSTELEFYSNVFLVRLTGVTGLLVLHGNDRESDIGLLVANDFLASENSVETQNVPDWYSMTNNGQKIPGQGKQVIHLLCDELPSNNPKRAYVAALTTQGGILADYSGLTYVGEYTDLFYGGIENPAPQRFTVHDDQEVLVDNGRLYVCNNVAMNKFYLNPMQGLYDDSSFSPYVVPFQNYSYVQEKVIAYDNTHECFTYWDTDWTKEFPLSISTPGKAFDMGNMNAQLVYMDQGGRLSHWMAVMKEAEGNYFLAEMDFTAAVVTDIPVARYELSSQTDFANAHFHAFGDNQINMCYYATPSAVYRYSAGNGTCSAAERLTTTDGTELDFPGEITLMKILKPYRLTADYNTGVSDFSYWNYNKIMLVATWDGSAGTLYALHLEETTGLVSQTDVYRGFGKIYDANIKGL